MSSDDKKIKTNPAPKNEVPLKDKSTSGVDTSKAEGGKIADASPSGYSRGEGQKPVSKAYKDNWNAIFAKNKEAVIRQLFCQHHSAVAAAQEKGPEELRAFIISLEGGLNSPYRPYRPYHRQAYRGHFPSSAFRRPWLPW